MNPAREVGGVIAAYPYPLRPDAKQAHPEVSPLPGTWEQCTPEQLIALECVDVQRVSPPDLQAGERCVEGDPEKIEGVWQQTWFVIPAPPPSVPEEVDALALELVLIAAGMNTAVDAYVETLAPAAKARWRRRPTMRRDAEDIEAGRVVLGLSHAQVDALFIAAKAMEGST